MAVSSTTLGLRIPATYPYNQGFAGSTGNIATDTESQPDISNSQNAVLVPPKAYSAEKRNIQVQTKVFRTDQDSGANNFQTGYTTVPKSAL